MFLLRLLAWLGTSHNAATTVTMPPAHAAMHAWSVGRTVARMFRYHDQR